MLIALNTDFKGTQNARNLIRQIENHNRKIKEAFNPENATSTKIENGIEITSHSFYITRHDEWNLNTKELDKFLDEMVEQSIDNVEVDVIHSLKAYLLVLLFTSVTKRKRMEE